MILPKEMIRSCRKAKFRWKIADGQSGEMTGGNVLMRSLILRRLLLREVLADDEKYIGILLPPSTGGVLTNAAVTLAGRIAVNLNYTLDSETMNACIRAAGLKHVLTSRRVLDKLDLQLDAEIICLEDLKEKLTTADKIAGAFGAFVTPKFILERSLGLHRIAPDDVMNIIFTSGSTGVPKGVMLTYQNIGSNVEAIGQVIHLKQDDVILGVLPFFHSFGYTVALWTVLSLDIHGVYHYSPLDARNIGKLCKKHAVNILMSTQTFLRSYLKRCKKEDFHAMEVVVAGAEKLPIPLCDAFEDKFGVRPIEGYGTTELSPLASVNIPECRSPGDICTLKEGSVGLPIPGVSAKVVDPDTMQPLPSEEEGMLLITGPNVMKGYLNMPEKTAEVLHDGWYITGDIAKIDSDGFIHITGRLSRFSKIGGEMVPHMKIEEALLESIGQQEDEPLRAVVTAVPDKRKGERIIVVHTNLGKTPEEVCKDISATGMSNLWVPSKESFMQVDEIPILGTGKLDLKGIANKAKERFGEPPTE